MCAANSLFGGQEIFVLDHFGDAFGLFFGRQASNRRVEVPLFGEQFGPEPNRVDRMLPQGFERAHGGFVSHGIHHALEGFPPVNHTDLKELCVFTLVPLA